MHIKTNHNHSDFIEKHTGGGGEQVEQQTVDIEPMKMLLDAN